MKNNIYKLALVFSTLVLTIACSEDDFTNDSSMTATNPSLSVALSFANTQTLVETEADYGFTVTLSEPQIVNTRVYLTQIGGSATNGEDFSMPGFVTIPAGSTSTSGVITIHADDLIEDTETAVIKIATGLESNVSAINDQTVTFNIQNLVEGDLAIGMSWAASSLTTNNSGEEIDPYDLADLRLLLTDVPYTTILDGADGGSAESYTLSGTTPDGEYYIVADFYAAMSNIPADLDLTLTLDQTGVINGETYSFSAALNTAISCDDAYYVLGKIVKVGESYTFEPIGENSKASAAPFVGTATVLIDDWADDYVNGEIEIEAGSNPDEFWVRMYSNPYIINPDTAYLIVTIDVCGGTVTGVSNEPWKYSASNTTPVTATGTVDYATKTIDLTLDYHYNMGTHYIMQLKLQL